MDVVDFPEGQAWQAVKASNGLYVAIGHAEQPSVSLAFPVPVPFFPAEHLEQEV